MFSFYWLMCNISSIFKFRFILSPRITGAMSTRLDLEPVTTRENVWPKHWLMHMPNRCQFDQHFTSSYLTNEKVFLSFSLITVWLHFCRKEICEKAVCKMLVKLTTVRSGREGCSNLQHLRAKDAHERRPSCLQFCHPGSSKRTHHGTNKIP